MKATVKINDKDTSVIGYDLLKQIKAGIAKKGLYHSTNYFVLITDKYNDVQASLFITESGIIQPVVNLGAEHWIHLGDANITIERINNG